MNASHPELEALAGLLDEPGGSADEPGLAAHVAGCSQCQADLNALRTVQVTLRALPAVPMPEAVAARLESTVRAHAKVSTDELASQQLPGPRRLHHGLPTGRQLPHLSVAAGVAVLLIVALGTGIAVMVTRGGSSTSHTAASSAGSSAAAGGEAAGIATVVVTSGADYDQGTIRSQVAALVVQRVPGSSHRFSGLQPLAAQTAAGLVAAPPAAPQASLTGQGMSSATSGGFAATTPTAPKQTLAANSAVAPARTAAGGPLADPTALRACVRTLNGGTPTEPVLVDYARFNGRPATIIVLPSAQSPTKLAVWVEPDGSDCATRGETAYYGTLSAAP